MKESRRIKIWILITHAIIIVVFGDSFAPMGLLGVLDIIGVFVINWSKDAHFNFLRFPLILGLICLAGQICMLFSLRRFREVIRKRLQLTGFILLWFPVIGFNMAASVLHESEIFITWGTAIPFFFCSINMLIGRQIGEQKDKVLSWIKERI